MPSFQGENMQYKNLAFRNDQLPAYRQDKFDLALTQVCMFYNELFIVP
jgi:hypothetical protein